MTISRLNPLFVKEMRTLFRGVGFPIILNSYLGLIAVILIGATVLALGKYYTTMTWEMGRNIVLGMGVYQLFALSVIAPSLTAATMSLERDRDTFDVLMVMPLGLARIVFYKTLAALMFLVMLVVASLPLLAGGFVLGGVAPGEIAVVALLTLMAVLATGALGLMSSSIFRRTIIAVPGACLVAGILIVATAFYLYFYRPALSFRYANPVIALLDHMDGATVGFFHTDLPVWVPCSAYLGLLSLLFLSIATEGFRFKFRRNYATAGGALLLLCLAVLAFGMGEPLRTMPETLDEGSASMLARQLLLLALLAAAVDPVLRTAQWGPARPVSMPGRVAAFLLRPGVGLTLTTVSAMAALWIGLSAVFPAMRAKPQLMFGAPLLAAAVALCFSALCRAVVRLRRWKHPVWARVIAAVLLLSLLGAAEATVMLAHAADNQATMHRSDVLLFANPLFACSGMGGDVLEPYPFLAGIMESGTIVWCVAAVYGAGALLLGTVALALGRLGKTAGAAVPPAA